MGNTQRSSAAAPEAAKLVQNAIASHPVVIFSKTYCPYCSSAKRDVAAAGKSVAGFQPAKVFELDTMGALGYAVQSYLARTTGRRTVPNVFIAGKTVGGGDDVAGYAHRGVLKQMLAQAAARLAAANTGEAKQLVEEAIEKFPVVIFSKTTCPYCSAAKTALAGVATRIDAFGGAKVFEVNTMGELGQQVQAYLAEKTGRRTVPNVFISGKSIGGGDEVRAYAASGELDRMVAAAIGAEIPGSAAVKTPKDFVEEAIANNAVVVFSKSYCPYCMRAKTLLANTGKTIEGYEEPKIIELDQMPEGPAIQGYLLEKTGQSTVPNIFIGREHVGGNDVLQGIAARNALVPLLKGALISEAVVDEATAQDAEAEPAVPVTAKDVVEDAIANNSIAVFSKSYCPYCMRAKALLASTGKTIEGFQEPKVLELDEREDGDAIQQYLFEKTGQRTVPNVFIGGKHVGGSDDLTGAAERNELVKLIIDAQYSKPAQTVESVEAAEAAPTAAIVQPAEVTRPAIKEIAFGAGCFWGVELAFQRVAGVVKTEVGYSNGKVPRVTYDAICSGLTGAAEVVRVWYDPEVVSLPRLLEVWESRHDPTSLNKQGNDIGSQYRSAVFWNDQEQADEIAKWNSEASTRLSRPIVTEVAPVKNYCAAEEYHQRYLEKKGQSAEKGSTANIRCYG